MMAWDPARNPPLAPSYVDEVDWGLVHELGHFYLELPDVYNAGSPLAIDIPNPNGTPTTPFPAQCDCVPDGVYTAADYNGFYLARFCHARCTNNECTDGDRLGQPCLVDADCPDARGCCPDPNHDFDVHRDEILACARHAGILTYEDVAPAWNGIKGRMGGADTWPWNDWRLWSRWSAWALNTSAQLRRGVWPRTHFGAQIWHTPTTTRVRVLDDQGAPVSGATVTGYQLVENQIDRIGELTAGPSNADGIVTLPNRPTGVSAVTTPKGYVPKANPFGLVDFYARNGRMMLVVDRPPDRWFRWLTVFDLNLAYARGETVTATVTLPHRVELEYWPVTVARGGSGHFFIAVRRHGSDFGGVALDLLLPASIVHSLDCSPTGVTVPSGYELRKEAFAYGENTGIRATLYSLQLPAPAINGNGVLYCTFTARSDAPLGTYEFQTLAPQSGKEVPPVVVGANHDPLPVVITRRGPVTVQDAPPPPISCSTTAAPSARLTMLFLVVPALLLILWRRGSVRRGMLLLVLAVLATPVAAQESGLLMGRAGGQRWQIADLQRTGTMVEANVLMDSRWLPEGGRVRVDLRDGKGVVLDAKGRQVATLELRLVDHTVTGSLRALDGETYTLRHAPIHGRASIQALRDLRQRVVGGVP
ncbi:hypothetical protein L6Q96_16890 [Candidatus Binatia bacterium]|nr:hypothetical protein [Candidatus Binatia bacterium]